MKRKHKIMLERIISAAILSVVAFLLPYGDNSYLELVIFVIPYLIVGYDVLWSALRNIAHGQIFDENFLMCIATVGAFCIGEYSEAVGVMIFYQTGELFSSIAVGKSRRSIAALMDIRPDSAVRLANGVEQTLSPDEIRVGEVIVVRAGERIALDGEVIDGESSLDVSALTGESIPRDVKVGDKVPSGSVNLCGVLKIRVEKEFFESTVSKILELVENAVSKKARSERFITRFARYYTPCVVFGAAALALIPSLVFGDAPTWIERALIFLMVSCPCALVISVPLSFFGGIGGASKRGVLIKGATHLEALAKVDTVVFDKTGTLTEGRFCVDSVYAVSCEKDELIMIAAYAENGSNHPIAASIREAYREKIDLCRIGAVKEYAGLGVEAEIDGAVCLAGNAALLRKAGVGGIPDVSGCAVHVSKDGEYLGYIVLCDRVKEDSKKAVSELRRVFGVKKTVMLTGDSRSAAERIAAELDIDESFAELMPSDKVELLERFIGEGSCVAFVGDGINDAPVLSRADVGIAMGGIGSDAAIEAADVVIMDDKPSKIVSAVKIARKTMRIVRQNVIFALSVKGLILLLGALGYAGMWIAIFGDVGVMMLAILNSTRAMRVSE